MDKLTQERKTNHLKPVTSVRKEDTSAKTTRMTAMVKGPLHEVVWAPSSNIHVINGWCNALYSSMVKEF